MSTSDYEIHLDRGRFDSLWGDTGDSDGAPFHEDMDDIDKAIAEELGSPRPRRKRRNRNG